MRLPGRAISWRHETLIQEKKAIKAELDAVAQSGAGPSARLQQALQKLAELETDNTTTGRLRRYIYAVSALVHHERYGGLKPKQVKGIAQIALAIVTVFRIKPGFSK